MDSGAKTECSSGDCEGEEQEDPSSSSFDDEMNEQQAGAASIEEGKDQEQSVENDLYVFREQWQKELEEITSTSDEVKPKDDGPQADIDDVASADKADSAVTARRGSSKESGDSAEDELAVFRAQWQRELEPSPAPGAQALLKQDEEPTSDLEKASADKADSAGTARRGSSKESGDSAEDELAVFRAQWQRELEPSPAPYPAPAPGAQALPKQDEDPTSDLEKASADKADSAGTACRGSSKESGDSAEDELAVFRAQWQRELEPSPAPDPAPAPGAQALPKQDEEPTSDLEKASADKADSAGTACRDSSKESGDSAEDELAVFRAQWQRELEPSPAPDPAPAPGAQALPKQDEDPTSDLEKAKKFFLRGAELERSGTWYEAIQHYKRAMALIPDIERRLYETTKGPEEEQEEKEEAAAAPVNTNTEEDSDEEMIEGEEVVARLLRIQARKGIFITPEIDTRSTHISALPYEVMQQVLRWVVSSELDCLSLEAAGATCRALHIAARDPELWRAVCLRTWGLECGTARAHGHASWRTMYILRPRLQLNGCYISKTTYLRHGENSFQDQFYRPWFLIDYYRYLRFFPEGRVLMCTTADEPAVCVKEMRWRTTRSSLGILSGHYRLIGNKVVIVIKKTNNEKKQPQSSTSRFRARRKEPEPEASQTFHMELELRSVKGRRNNVLSWARYRVARRDNWTSFDLTPRAFPPFAFSRVKAYTREASAPL